MKIFKYIVFSLAVCAGTSSCSFLDKQPYTLTDKSYFKNEMEVNSFVTGMYSSIGAPSFYGNNYIFIAGGDDTEHYGGVGRPPSNYGIICNNATASDQYITDFWYQLYEGINRCNILLENVDNVQDMPKQGAIQAKATARFLRAFYYFNLVQNWGDVPFLTSSTQSVNDLSVARTDKNKIYDFIVNEMSDAAKDLPTAASLDYKPGYVSKSAAWGMLTRVYLFRAGEHNRDHVEASSDSLMNWYKKASEYGQLVKNEGGHTLAPKYWDYFIDLCSNRYNTTGKESIWEAEFSGDYTTDVRTEGRIGNIIGINAPDLSSKSVITGKADPGYSYAFIYSTPKLYEMYEDNKDKIRMDWNIQPFTYTEVKRGDGVTGRVFEKGKLAEIKKMWYDQSFQYGDTKPGSTTGDREKTTVNNDYSRAISKYRREYEPAPKKNKNFTSINFPIVRYSDVLLMIAEAENEIHHGPTPLAYECINMVRSRVHLKPFSGLDHDAFLAKLKEERAMELCGEMLRRYDLIRWGDFVKDMNALVARAQSGTNWSMGPSNVYTYFQVSSAYNYLPIPSREMSVNNLITKNNPGW